LAAREKGGKPESNAQLRSAIEKAQAINMPKDTIERAIKKGATQESLTPVLYEAFGPGGVAFIIEGITDNNNRTSAELRKVLGDHDAKMASGSALWAFEKQGEEWVPKTTIEVANEEIKNKLRILEEALDDHDDVQDVYFNAEL